MALASSDVASLKLALDWWEWAEYVSTGVVFIGCVGEFVTEFTRFSNLETTRHRAARLSLVLVIAGIAGELCATVRTSELSGQIIAYVERNASDAKASAETAADASKRAGDAAHEAESLAHSAREGADSFEKDIVSAKEQAALAESHLVGARRSAAEADAKAVTAARDLASLSVKCSISTRLSTEPRLKARCIVAKIKRSRHGVVVVGCPTCRVRLNTTYQFVRHWKTGDRRDVFSRAGLSVFVFFCPLPPLLPLPPLHIHSVTLPGI
jgi:hypothetical protein